MTKPTPTPPDRVIVRAFLTPAQRDRLTEILISRGFVHANKPGVGVLSGLLAALAEDEYRLVATDPGKEAARIDAAEERQSAIVQLGKVKRRLKRTKL